MCVMCSRARSLTWCRLRARRLRTCRCDRNWLTRAIAHPRKLNLEARATRGCGARVVTVRGVRSRLRATLRTRARVTGAGIGNVSCCVCVCAWRRVRSGRQRLRSHLQRRAYATTARKLRAQRLQRANDRDVTVMCPRARSLSLRELRAWGVHCKGRRGRRARAPLPTRSNLHPRCAALAQTICSVVAQRWIFALSTHVRHQPCAHTFQQRFQELHNVCCILIRTPPTASVRVRSLLPQVCAIVLGPKALVPPKRAVRAPVQFCKRTLG